MTICAYSISIEINKHREEYKSVIDYLYDLDVDPNECILDGIEKEVLWEMDKTDVMIKISASPTRIGSSYEIYHYDLDIALDNILASIEEDRKPIIK